MAEYIEREAVIAVLLRYGMTDDGEAIINAIPAADVVERKKGHINVDIGGNRFCTECGIQMLTLYLDETKAVTRPNFCPKCGADLREDEHDNH